jgi:hypothetical protein
VRHILNFRRWLAFVRIFECQSSDPYNGKSASEFQEFHVFSSLSKNIACSDLIGRLKGASSKRLKDKKFSYQEEIREIFNRHRVALDERYVWD